MDKIGQWLNEARNTYNQNASHIGQNLEDNPNAEKGYLEKAAMCGRGRRAPSEEKYGSDVKEFFKDHFYVDDGLQPWSK